jgi:hypothetical protein
MKSLYSSLFILLAGLPFLAACVGTVQDTGLPKTSIAAEPKTSINFGGVYAVTPISQSKFEIFFYPATGGSGRYNYIIYVGDRPVPMTLPSEVMLQDYRGLLKATVIGLETGKSYFVKVEAQDQVTEGKDKNDMVLESTTFLNLVADFTGIASVTNSAGVDGLDSIKIRWPHAFVDVGSVGGSTTDPKSYEIVAVDSNLLTPANMDDKTKGPTQGRFVKSLLYNAQINETVIRGLKADTKYYIRVRALHKDSIDDANNPRMRGELNTNYLSIKTLSADLSSINFKPDGLEVLRNEGSAQSTSLVLKWPTASGVFDHFRVYYSQDEANLNSLDTSECPLSQAFGCKKYPPSATGAIIANLEQNKDYFFRLMVCQFDDCETYILGDIKPGSTKPLLASFSGIASIRSAANINEVGKMFVTFPLPNFNEGDFDGYHIAYRPNLSVLPEVINLPTYEGEIVVEPFDYRTATSITFTGIDYSTDSNYCFSVYPFVYLYPSGYTAYENGTWMCTQAEVTRATLLQFPGLIGAETSGNDLLLTWAEPAVGIFDMYEVYLRKTDGSFSFSAARSQLAALDSTNYVTAVVDRSQLTHRFTNVANGKYRMGVLTYFAYIPPAGDPLIYRSEDNEGIYTCIVDGTDHLCSAGN